MFAEYDAQGIPQFVQYAEEVTIISVKQRSPESSLWTHFQFASICIVKYIPSSSPGVGFKRKAAIWCEKSDALCQCAFSTCEERSGAWNDICITLIFFVNILPEG